MASARDGLDALTRAVDRTSRSWVLFIAVAIGFALLLGLLMVEAADFEEVSGGQPPFDLQNSLTVDDITQQLALYTDAAAGRYLSFTLVDFLFPLVGGLLLASVAAACLRTSSPDLHARLLRSNLYLLFFVPTLFDWTENVYAIWLVLAGDPASSVATTGLVLAKVFKLATLWASQLVVAGTIVWWVWRRIVGGRSRAPVGD